MSCSAPPQLIALTGVVVIAAIRDASILIAALILIVTKTWCATPCLVPVLSAMQTMIAYPALAVRDLVWTACVHTQSAVLI